MQFLVVDDAPAVACALEKGLERQGIDPSRIDVVGSGEEAIETFRDRQPDVVFMDVQLPGIDGQVAASEITAADPTTYVVVITGADREDRRVRQMISHGAFEFLQKPIRLEELEGVLELIERETSGSGRIH